jgi:hypothetical protein
MVLGEPMEFLLQFDQLGRSRPEDEQPLVIDGRQLVVASEEEDRQGKFGEAPLRLVSRFLDGSDERPIIGTEAGEVRFRLDHRGRQDPRLVIRQLDLPASVEAATAPHGFVHQPVLHERKRSHEGLHVLAVQIVLVDADVGRITTNPVMSARMRSRSIALDRAPPPPAARWRRRSGRGARRHCRRCMSSSSL